MLSKIVPGGGYKSQSLDKATSQANNSILSKNSTILVRWLSTGLFSFLIAFAVVSILSPVERSGAIECINGTVSGSSASDICGTDTTEVNVSITGAWTISVSSSGTLGLDLTPNSSGTLSTVVDNLNVYTNTPNGYQLYLNSTSGSTDIYNNNILDENGNIISDPSSNPDGSGIINTNHFSATTGTKASPIALTNNTWGYSLAPSPTTFSKVELTNTSADSLISTGSKTTGAGDDIDVTYGFKADTKLTPGTYSTQVTYTAVADVPAYGIQQVTPDILSLDQGSTDITIVTTTPATELGLGDITASIKNSTLGIDLSLTNCSETTVEISGINYRAATCTYPGGTIEQGGLPVGTYTIELTSSWHASTYLFTDALTVTSPYTITSVTPDVGNNNAETTITMITDALTANSTAFGTVTGKIGNTNMSNCTATTSGNYRAVQCTIPSGVTAGTYTVQFTAAGHSSTTYSKASAVTIRAYLTVSGGSGSGWYALNTTVSITADACSAGYIFNNWTTTGGTIADANAASTTITTGPDNITVTRNCRAKTISDITTMQEITSTICAATPTGTKATLRDTRGSGNAGSGNGNYGVVKAADGNCWMTDNLNLYNKTIAASDSDFTSPTSYIIPAGITATTDWPGNVVNAPKVEVAHGFGEKATQDQAYWGQVFYNWTAAAAIENALSSSTTPDTSICPKGWTLPTNGDTSTNKSWAKLLDTYSITTGSQLLANTELGFSLYYGQYDSGGRSENYQGSQGHFWSGSFENPYYARNLYYNSNNVNPQTRSNAGRGFSIRCVAR